MKTFPTRFAICTLFAAALTAGCNSTGNRQVLLNDGVSEKVNFGDGAVKPVGHNKESNDSQIRPIGTSTSDEAKPSSWSRLLSPFQSERKRIPLPITKPDESRSGQEVGIDEF